MSKLLDIIAWAGLVIVLMMFASVIALSIFTQQERVYEMNGSCIDLRECIILELSCLEHETINTFLTFEWSIYSNSSMNHQKEYYKNNCYQKELNDALGEQDE